MVAILSPMGSRIRRTADGPASRARLGKVEQGRRGRMHELLMRRGIDALGQGICDEVTSSVVMHRWTRTRALASFAVLLFDLTIDLGGMDKDKKSVEWPRLSAMDLTSYETHQEVPQDSTWAPK